MYTCMLAQRRCYRRFVAFSYVDVFCIIIIMIIKICDVENMILYVVTHEKMHIAVHSGIHTKLFGIATWWLHDTICT